MLDLPMIVGAVLFFAGGITALVTLGTHGGMAFGFTALSNIRAMLKKPRPRGIFLVAALVAGVGAALCLGSVLMRDAEANGACRRACEAAGYQTGIVRGSPHVEPRRGAARDCWCRTGRTWAPDPLPDGS